jgi:hypothetical protein
MFGEDLIKQPTPLLRQFREDDPAIVQRGAADQQLLLFQLIDRIGNIAARAVMLPVYRREGIIAPLSSLFPGSV